MYKMNITQNIHELRDWERKSTSVLANLPGTSLWHKYIYIHTEIYIYIYLYISEPAYIYIYICCVTRVPSKTRMMHPSCPWELYRWEQQGLARILPSRVHASWGEQTLAQAPIILLSWSKPQTLHHGAHTTRRCHPPSAFAASEPPIWQLRARALGTGNQKEKQRGWEGISAG